MATRSSIAMRHSDGTVTSVYAHWDGYPSGVGATLRQHYTDTTTITRLLALGDLSSLGNEIGDQNDFANPVEHVCLFYGRDRGETGVAAQTHATPADWREARAASGCEYGYLWDGEEWHTWTLDFIG
jgi:hypothetical protein